MPSSSSSSNAVSTIAPAAQLAAAFAALLFLKAFKRAQNASAPASEVVGAYESTLSQLCNVALPHVAPKHSDPGKCS
jgi:hypothetical protein